MNWSLLQNMCLSPINTAPHGICFGVDGETIWFAGKRTSTTHTLPSKKVMMHRIKKDAAGNLWFTEMMADRLGKVTLK